MTKITEDAIRRLIARSLDLDPGALTPESRFFADLAVDSFEMTQVVMDIEEAYAIEISDDDAEGLQTVADAVRLVERLLAGEGDEDDIG